MVNIAALLAGHGNARELLKLAAGTIPWSDARSLGMFEVIKQIEFEDFEISKVEVCLDFVGCSFSECRLRDLKTIGHLWGADDTWNQCVFERCMFDQMGSPMNSFTGCKFHDIRIVRYRPYQTLFDSCDFTQVVVEGMRPYPVHNKQNVNLSLRGVPGQLLFRNCRFNGVEFRRCYFEQAVFERCSFNNVVAQACSFDGVVSDAVWWDNQRIDPFTEFLGSALDLIRKKCGPESPAYREFESYMIDYESGRTTSRDFSACLYTNRVPYLETEKFMDDLERLAARHPF